MRWLALLALLVGCDYVFKVNVRADAAPPEVPVGDEAGVTAEGCSDKTREGFTNGATYPRIAGCAGGWTMAGVNAISGPACGRLAGNTSGNPTGAGCNAEDLCQSGWHLCLSQADVAQASPTGCTDPGAPANQFFVTRQSSDGAMCATGGLDDLFGCGTQGTQVAGFGCDPLDRTSGNLCSALLVGGWICSDMQAEARTVLKTDVDGGGALCCKN